MNNQELTKKTQALMDKQIKERGYATIVDILLDLGYLTKQNYDNWRFGKIPYLEKACTVNLNKLNIIVKTAHSYATKHNYKKSITFYKKYKSKKKIKLRFSASNNEYIEQAYSTHFVLNCVKSSQNDDSKQNKCIKRLKDIVFEFGPNYLNEKPFEVYEELLKIENVNRRLCSGILCVLVNGVIDYNDDFEDVKALSKKIQNSCDLNSKLSNILANIFSKLFSQENKKLFLETKDNNLNTFLKSELPILWDGYSVWHYPGGYVECFYKGDMLLLPNKKVLKNKGFKTLMIENPYSSVKMIQEYFIRDVCKYLDNDFENYCTCEKYYVPTVEDYYFESNLEYWCKENGFNILKCEGSGYDGGYTPDF